VKEDVVMDQPVARSRKYQVLKVVLWTGNHIVRWQLRHGLGPRAFALLEPLAHRSSRPPTMTRSIASAVPSARA
jgi:hypothetical protein